MKLMIKEFPDEIAEGLETIARGMVPPTTRNQLLLAVLKDYIESRPAPQNRLRRADLAAEVRQGEAVAA